MKLTVGSGGVLLIAVVSQLATGVIGAAYKGACCPEAGSGKHCFKGTYDECKANGGTYQGDHTTCETVYCPTLPPTKYPTPYPTVTAPTPVPTPKPFTKKHYPGACCTLFDGCKFYSEETCKLQGGTFQGPYVECKNTDCPIKGACCLSYGCKITFKKECTNQRGDFKGLGTDCTPGLCPTRYPTPTPVTHPPTKKPTISPPTGACCDINAGTCLDTTASHCDLKKDLYLGDGTKCKPGICPTKTSPGACCVKSGRCYFWSQKTCAKNGYFLGPGTTCDNVVCPIGPIVTPGPTPASTSKPVGACCFSNGLCRNLRPGVCRKRHGKFLGIGTKCNYDNTCPLPHRPITGKKRGACCFKHTCRMLNAKKCHKKGGHFVGGGTKCSKRTCSFY